MGTMKDDCVVTPERIRSLLQPRLVAQIALWWKGSKNAGVIGLLFWCRTDGAGSQGVPDPQHDAVEVETLRKALEEQGAALQEAAAQRQAAEERARRLQQDVERLSVELHESGPASDLQRQFREVNVPVELQLLTICNVSGDCAA